MSSALFASKLQLNGHNIAAKITCSFHSRFEIALKNAKITSKSAYAKSL